MSSEERIPKHHKSGTNGEKDVIFTNRRNLGDETPNIHTDYKLY